MRSRQESPKEGFLEHNPLSLQPSSGVELPWTWCARCQRAYVTGAFRLVRFSADALHPHPASLVLCPYFDYSANANRYGWQWRTIQLEHPEYPAKPEPNVVYLR